MHGGACAGRAGTTTGGGGEAGAIADHTGSQRCAASLLKRLGGQELAFEQCLPALEFAIGLFEAWAGGHDYLLIAGLAGGITVGAFDLDIPPQMYIARMHDTMEVRHMLVGLSKAPVFALVIGLIGCLEGLKVEGTAQSVGERTTSSVVQTISLVIIIDAFAALWFMHMDW